MLLRDGQGIVRKEYTNVGSLAGAGVWTSSWFEVSTVEDTVSLISVCKHGVASAGEKIEIELSNDGSTVEGYAPRGDDAATLSTNSTSAATMVTTGRPLARYARVKFTNGSVAQTALKMHIGFLKGV